ncbi:hypothetical protein BCR33DRAFT_852102 [Rhizoclosmatium globosum]|uniref:RING-type domain-containing protein n=1 Tax=Rhizoclosmatium globosum TaxID=329046 RepID=A0A1Y2C3W8_9FUNG|nr:hypothetical protein BCR33DRAFT_852102 [Rhizoclosmatium globosum]|eukprot:ORY41584.1 hypothetical protein BCR33DRAFT_852102 [Rhizoclosmatium globosum]
MGFVEGASASSSATAAPAPLKKALSRSISFQLIDDESLVDKAAAVAKAEPVIPELPYFVLGSFSLLITNNSLVYQLNQANIVGTHVRYTVKQFNSWRNKTKPWFQLAQLNTSWQLPKAVSDLFPMISVEECVDAKCEFWIKATRQHPNILLDLEVRWPNPSFDALKDPQLKDEKFIALFWANGGNPFQFIDNEFVWSDSGTDSLLKDFKVPPTFDIVPCIGPEAPFALTLYDYQLRTLAWMQGIEDAEPSLFYASNLIPMAEEDGEDDDLFMDLSTFEFGTKDTQHFRNRNVKSGIIADKPGVGKTITTLALCHTRPFDNPSYLHKTNPENGRFLSKAVCLLVPNNIAHQWESEIRKCLGETVSILQIKGKQEYSQTSLATVLESDFIILSYQFLTNGAYKGAKSHGRDLANYGKKFDFANSPSDCKEFCESRVGDFAFTWVHFHRIVCDEFHEVTDKAHGIREQVRAMSADYLWGLTGTPRFEDPQTVAKFAGFLNIEPWICPDVESFRFIQHRVRRNEPEVTFPPPIYQVQKVTQTPMERAFYQSCLRNLSIVELLKLCNHYQIGNQAVLGATIQAMTIEKVTELVQQNRINQMEDLDKKVETATKAIKATEKEKIEEREKAQESDAKMAKLPAKLKSLDDRITRLRAEIVGLKAERAPIQAQFTYFQNFVDTYLSRKGNMECNICMEEDVKTEIGILPCGHAFCWECAEDVVKVHSKCPNCRVELQGREVMRVLPPAVEEEVKEALEAADQAEEGDKLDPDMFGSKIREMVNYLRNEMKASDEARFIVFIQFADLADLVSGALNTYGIATARLKKGWQDREKALRLFRAGLTKPVGHVASAAEPEGPTVTEESNAVEVEGSVVEFPVLQAGDKGKRKADFIDEDVSKKPAKIRKVEAKKVEKPVKILMLSARDSVSGLNLTEATHCIVLHPFHSDIDEYAIASEKQGVARVLRNGQTKTVKIVRFYVENTVEAQIHLTRVQIHGENQVE